MKFETNSLQQSNPCTYNDFWYRWWRKIGKKREERIFVRAKERIIPFCFHSLNRLSTLHLYRTVLVYFTNLDICCISEYIS